MSEYSYPFFLINYFQFLFATHLLYIFYSHSNLITYPMFSSLLHIEQAMHTNLPI